MISRENYEIWMIDYLDGVLSDDDQELLFRFLDENPDLKSELDGLDKTILNAPISNFEGKAKLLKTEADVLEMDYPEYIAIKEQEEGLDVDETTWKKDYLRKSSAHAFVFKVYANIKLKADKRIIFKRKSALKRATLIPWANQHTLRKVSVAAVVAILLSIGTIPLLKDQSNTIQTIVVNDPPSLIKLPSSGSKEPTSTAIIESGLKNNPSSSTVPEVKSDRTKDAVVLEKIKYAKLRPIQPQGIVNAIQTIELNAYEIGLNAMMPILIASNLERKQLAELEKQNYIEQQSMRLSRSSRAIASGVKVINFLVGNETQVKKYINQNGDLVAYQLKSDNISISRKIKSAPVTN